MALTLIKEHNENILGIQTSPDNHEEPEFEPQKRPIIFSIIKKPPSKIYKSAKPDPKKFLRKRIPSKPCFKYTRRGLKTPGVPKTIQTVKEQDEKLKFTPPNIIKRNIDNVVNAKPKSPKRVVVVDHHGTRRRLSEIDVTYINKKEFGKIPEYVIKDKMLRDQKKLREILKIEAAQQPKCMYLKREKRKQLLDGLKNNWQELQRQYQTTPILTDTIPKIYRKTQLETDMTQIEKDIVCLERHPYIYVYADDEL